MHSLCLLPRICVLSRGVSSLVCPSKEGSLYIGIWCDCSAYLCAIRTEYEHQCQTASKPVSAVLHIPRSA